VYDGKTHQTVDAGDKRLSKDLFFHKKIEQPSFRIRNKALILSASDMSIRALAHSLLRRDCKSTLRGICQSSIAKFAC
jgi:hypothetical protein